MIMKKLLFLVLCAFAMVATSCDDEEKFDKPDVVTGATAYVGTLSVTQGDGSVFTKDSITVEVNYNDSTSTASLYMKQVKFAERMPVTLDMLIDGVSYKTVGETIEISGNNIVPEAMGGEFPAYTITNLAGTLTKGNADFSMVCGTYLTSFKGLAKTE